METLLITPLHSEDMAAEAASHIYAALSQAGFFSTPSPVLVVSGGSNCAVAHQLLEKFPDQMPQLTVLQTDERWLSKESNDSNSVQLEKVGVIKILSEKRAAFVPLIQDYSLTGTESAQKAHTIYKQILSSASQIVMLAGVGADGHTAGMLPMTSSESFHHQFADSSLVTYYEVNPSDSKNAFTQRITTTLKVLGMVDFVFIFAVGEDKRTVLQSFKQKDRPLNQVPALGLYLSQQPVQLLTDQNI